MAYGDEMSKQSVLGSIIECSTAREIDGWNKSVSVSTLRHMALYRTVRQNRKSIT